MPNERGGRTKVLALGVVAALLAAGIVSAQPKAPSTAPRRQERQAPFSPKSVTTGELTFTGQRFAPRTVTSDELTFTGQRFAPKVVTSGELTFTGRR